MSMFRSPKQSTINARIGHKLFSSAERSRLIQLTKIKKPTLSAENVRSLNYLIGSLAILLLLFTRVSSAVAETRIIGEFEYSIDDNRMNEWQIGPAFELSDALELEVPIGQDNKLWLVAPELIYGIEANDITFEFNVGLEAPLTGEPFEGFGGIEGRIDF